MKQIRLVDGAFFPRAKSASLAGDNLGLGPKHFEWVDNDDQSGVTFFTDICLEQAITDKSPIKVAWLIEPPEVSREHYELVRRHMGIFKYILTWDKGLLNEYASHWGWDDKSRDMFLFYPFGGSWIRDWQVYPKSKLCSIIVSDKTKTEGHKLRHEIVKQFGDRIDVFGRGYNPIESKLEALRDYQYSIVVENARSDYWFTEKLIDCFACGTIPIYWGCPSIRKYFPTDFMSSHGMITGGLVMFDTIERLDTLINALTNRNIEASITSMNFAKAKQYRCAEDWIYEHYPFLFDRRE